MPKKFVPTKKSTIKKAKPKLTSVTKQMGPLEKFRRMATVIQDSNDAITFQDLEGNILAWNQGAEIIYGYSQAEALSMNIVDTVPKEYQEEARAFLSSLKRGELVPNLETKRKHKDGHIIDVWLTNTKLTDDKGKLTGIATTERDITEQTKTLEKFRRMATVIQDSNDAITFQDLEGNILAWNRGAEIIYGYSEAEALKMNIVDTVPKEYQAQARGFLASLKRGELLPNLETKRKTKDGRIVDVWLTNTKLTDDKGILTGIATTERDITERNRTEGKLREKFRELEYLREGQIALSEKMRGEQVLSSLAKSILNHLVLFTNAQVAAFYWVSEHDKLQLISSYALSKTEDITIQFGEGLIGEAALGKKPLLVENVPGNYFNKIKSHLGEMVPNSLLICPILCEGEVNAVIELGSFNTFTEHQKTFLSHVSDNIGVAINTSVVRKKVQHLLEQSQTDNEELHARQEELRVSNEELEEQTQALEQQKKILNEKNDALKKAQVLLVEKASEIQRASQYKTEFLANMSHELRTPLNSTLILSKLLMDNAKGNLSSEQVEFAEAIYSSGNDLLNIINDILDLSKVEAGKLDIRVENVILPKMINEMKVGFLHLAREKKIDFQIQLDSDLPNSIMSDKQRLDQILKNLLSNAFKFTSAGSIQLRLYNAIGDKIAFEVRDSGIGIPKEQQEIIFEAFRQADGTTNRKYGGSGLGLSISKDLARLLGGSIQVESTQGQGSIFTLIIPKIFNEETAPTPVKAYTHNSSIVPTLDAALPLPFTDDRLNSKDSSRLILVIEEEAKYSKILLDLAHELNYTCIVAQGADEGFQMAQDFNPEAILLDMKLPDHLGLTVMDRLRESAKTKNIPVHVISSEDYTEETLDLGAVGYVLKPVTRERIKEIFSKLEEKFSQKIHRVLILEDDKIQRESISHLIADEGVETTMVGLATEALAELKNTVFDCMIMDLGLPGMDGYELLEKLAQEDIYSFPPVIVYTGSDLSREEEDKLRKYSNSIIIKGTRSSERLLDEVTLFLHRVEEKLTPKRRQMLKEARSREQLFEGRKILLVDDDVRNIFALSSVLEQRGATIIIGRNGQEALNQLEKDPNMDLVLMDIMMPEMDGYEATRRIRIQKRFAKLPIIAVTAKAMLDDQEKCMEAGTNDFIAKPVDVDKLLSLMRVWMPKLGRFHG